MKEMRLRGIDGMEADNAYLSEFMADFNRRFAVALRNPQDATARCCTRRRSWT